MEIMVNISGLMKIKFVLISLFVIVVFILAFGATNKLLRYRRSMVASNACIMNLLDIKHAKELWFESHKDTEVNPLWDDLCPYFARDCVCPQGGVYTIGQKNGSPKCSIGGHGHSYEAKVPASTLRHFDK